MNLPPELVPIVGLVAVGWLVNRSLVVVSAHEQVVVTDDGTVVDLLEPGVNLSRPFGRGRTHYDMRGQTLTMGERVTTADGDDVPVKATLRFRVDDARRLHETVPDYQDELVDVMRRELHSAVGRAERAALADDVVAGRLADRVEREVGEWGIAVDGADVRERPADQ